MFVIHKHLFVICVCDTQICGPKIIFVLDTNRTRDSFFRANALHPTPDLINTARTTDYLGTADGRVGDAHNTGFFSASKRPIHLRRARRATNRVEDVWFAV